MKIAFIDNTKELRFKMFESDFKVFKKLFQKDGSNGD